MPPLVFPPKHADHKPVKLWVSDDKGDQVVPFEQEALSQLRNVASLPFVVGHVAAMPDVHVGKGATVGSVIATSAAIIPAAVGVDLGCGMMAYRTSFKASDLPDSLAALRSSIERGVPHGRTHHGGPGDQGAFHRVPERVADAWVGLKDGYDAIVAKYPKLDRNQHPTHHLGTLGTGNHFIEVCLDEEQRVWVMLHSGSRGVGNRIGSFFIEKAKEEMRRWHINLPDADLAYLSEGSTFYGDYVEAVGWAQRFALANREVMMAETLRQVYRLLNPEHTLPKGQEPGAELAVNCHHNYVARERHFGKDVWVTRKGAVEASAGVYGIIPGSMGARSYIVRGKGSRDAFNSCSHGAGRRMSRTQARKTFTLEDHAKAVEGVECRRDTDVLDETPGAYKDIEAVMAAQSDLVEVAYTLKQVLCVKG